MDTNRHVNNIHYLEYALEALPEEVFAALPGTVDSSDAIDAASWSIRASPRWSRSPSGPKSL